MGEEVYGRTLAVLGLGRIGSEVAVRLQAFGMKVIGFDPMVTKEQAEAKNIELLSLEQIWPQADYITVHVPLIKQTENLINKESKLSIFKSILFNPKFIYLIIFQPSRNAKKESVSSTWRVEEL